MLNEHGTTSSHFHMINLHIEIRRYYTIPTTDSKVFYNKILKLNWLRKYKSLGVTLKGSSCSSPIILKGVNSTNWLLIHSFIFPIFSDFVCVSVKDRRNLSPNTRAFHVLGKRLLRSPPSLHWLHVWWNGWNGPIIKHSIDDFTLQTNILICSTEPTRPPTISQKCLF